MSQSIIIAGDNWCPINCAQESENKGFMIDVAIEALALSDYQVTYIEAPWTRAVGLARKGEINAIVGAFKDDAPDFYFPQTPLLKISPNNLYTIKSNDWEYHDIQSLSQVILGVTKGYDYGEELNTYIKTVTDSNSSKVHQVYGDDTAARSIQLLLKKRIDVFAETGPVFWYQAKKLNALDKVKQVKSINQPEPCYIAFSPAIANSKAISNALDKGIIVLRQQGKLKILADKYGLPAELYQ